MSAPAASTLTDVRLVPLQAIANAEGLLAVSQFGRELPFIVQRMFSVTAASSGASRGHHAHRGQQQFLVCAHGSVTVTVDDGCERRSFVLDSPSLGLYLPAGIWAEQVYGVAETVLIVLCDAGYDESDYLRDYDQFLRFKSVSIMLMPLAAKRD